MRWYFDTDPTTVGGTLADAEEYTRQFDDAQDTEPAEAQADEPEQKRATLNVQRFDTGNRDEWRGQFDTKGATWAWGRYEDGELWAECIETDECYGNEDMLLENVSGADLRTLFCAVAALVGAGWSHVVITDDYGKTKRVKL